MVGIVSGIGEPTRPPHQQSGMNRFVSKPVYQCMVKGCSNEMDPGSTQHLCRPCYDVITTGDTDRYYADFQGNTWIGQIIRWNNNLRQEVRELEYNQDHAYLREDDKYMSLNDLRNFYVDHNNLYGKALGSSVIDKRLLKDAQDALYKTSMENLSLRDVIRDLEKGHEQKDQHIDSLRKEIEALNYNIDHAHQIDFGKYMSVDDLCIFYQEHKKYKGPSVIDDYKRALDQTRATIRQLEEKIDSMEYDQTHAYTHEDGSYSSLNDLRTFYHLNRPATKTEPKDDGRFQAYTDGFTKGFDMGYAKARDQFYE